MVSLLLGVVIFFGVHLVPSMAVVRHKIISTLGVGPYKGLYSILALVGITLIFYGRSTAGYQPLWEPPVWSKNVVFVVMLVSFYLFAASEMKSNIKRFLRHPMLLGVTLWSGAHLFANGDLVSLLLFGSFFIFSLFAMYSANRRGAIKQENHFPITRDVATVIAGLVVYAIFIKYLHPLLFDVAII